MGGWVTLQPLLVHRGAACGHGRFRVRRPKKQGRKQQLKELWYHNISPLMSSASQILLYQFPVRLHHVICNQLHEAQSSNFAYSSLFALLSRIHGHNFPVRLHGILADHFSRGCPLIPRRFINPPVHSLTRKISSPNF